MGSIEGAGGSEPCVCLQSTQGPGAAAPAAGARCPSLQVDAAGSKDESSGLQLARQHSGLFLFCPKLSDQKDRVAREFREDTCIFLNFTNASCLLKSN